MNKNWNSVKKVGLPELEEVTTTKFSSVYKSKEVIIQTKRGERFCSILQKRSVCRQKMERWNRLVYIWNWWKKNESN